MMTLIEWNLSTHFFPLCFFQDSGVIPLIGCKEKKDSFTDVTFTYDDVFQVIIVNLKSKTSTGPNGLSSVFLKNLAPTISFPLMLIYCQSFQSGTIPEIWKAEAKLFWELIANSNCASNFYRTIRGKTIHTQ